MNDFYSRRLRALEEQVRRRTNQRSPIDAWEALLQCDGNPRDIQTVCQPVLYELRQSMLYYAEIARQARQSGGAVPYHYLVPFPIVHFAELIAIPPDDAVDDVVLIYRRNRLPYEPDRWYQLSEPTRIPGSEYSHGTTYYEWMLGEITWQICPDPDAQTLRQQLHNHPSPNMPKCLVDANPRELWSTGLFGLINYFIDHVGYPSNRSR